MRKNFNKIAENYLHSKGATLLNNEFLQNGPILKNQFESDLLLKNYLKKTLPDEVYQQIKPDLVNFGSRVVGDILDMGLDAEVHEPELIQYDAWGHRIDQIKTAKGWVDLHQTAASEGLVGIG